MSEREWDEETLLAELASALSDDPAARPPASLALEKALFTWHSIDAELATITFDSMTGSAALLVRTETAVLRTMTFQSPSLTVELGLTPNGLVGQVVPPGPGTARVRTTDGTGEPVEINDLGCFVIDVKPTARFRVVCETADGVSVATDWITP
jgi:hypothetical protein